jgi:hypothetical protein
MFLFLTIRIAMKKKLLSLLFSGLLFASFSTTPVSAMEVGGDAETESASVNPILSFCHQHPWAFIGYTFYDQLKYEGYGKRYAVAGVVSGFASLFAATAIKETDPYSALALVGVTISSFASACYCSTTVIEKTLRKKRVAIFTDFINNWTENKKYTPKELHDFFEHVSTRQQSERTLSFENILDCYEIVLQQLFGHDQVYRNKEYRAWMARGIQRSGDVPG